MLIMEGVPKKESSGLAGPIHSRKEIASSATLPGNGFPHMVKPDLWSFPGSLVYLAKDITNIDNATLLQSITNIIDIIQI